MLAPSCQVRVAFISTDLGVGGTQQWVELTATELAKRGHRVTVLAERMPHDRVPKLQQAGVQVYAFKRPPALVDYARLLPSVQAELIHLSIWERTQELIRLRSLTGLPVALNYQHVPTVSWRTWAVRLKPGCLLRVASRLVSAVRFVDAHIGCCETSARGIRRELWPFSRSRIVALCNAIPLPAPTPDDVMLGPARFIQVGALNERKNPMATLRAFAVLQQRIPSATLCFVGDGPLRPALEQFVREQNLRGVTFIGQVPDSSDYYRQSNICVLPTRREGLPYTLIEAAGCGLPLIASDVDGNCEIVRDRQTGILIPSDADDRLVEAMVALAANPDLRVHLGRNARALVEQRFELGKQIDSLLDIYRIMLNPGALHDSASTGHRGKAIELR